MSGCGPARTSSTPTPIAAIPALVQRPLLLIYGTADDVDVPAKNALVVFERANEAGVPVEIRARPGATHGQVASADGCQEEYRGWVVPLFERALGTSSSPATREAFGG